MAARPAASMSEIRVNSTRCSSAMATLLRDADQLQHRGAALARWEFLPRQRPANIRILQTQSAKVFRLRGRASATCAVTLQVT